MIDYYQISLFSLAIFIFLIFQMDDNVRQYFIIKYDMLILQIKDRFLLWMILHPKNPISNYFFEKKYKKLEKIMEENPNGNV